MRKIPIRLIACLAALGLIVGRAGGTETGLMDTEGAIRSWHTAEGLPSDSVTSIIQTRDGFLWIGTGAGLVRFDGVKFSEAKLAERPADNPFRISALCEDSHGFLWIGTQQNGLFRLAHGKFQQYTKANGLMDDSVTSLAAEGQGNVWIGTRSGLNVFNGSQFKSFSVEDGLPDELVSGVHVARSGTVWITTRAGMCRFIEGKIAPYALQTGSQGRSPEYLGAYEDRKGNLWAFGDTYLINLAEGKRFNYFRGNEATSVRIWSLCEGRDSRLWIGTSGRGLFCFDDNRFQPVILGELRWPYDVRAICEDREGNLWLGTSGGGLVQLRPQPVHKMQAGQGLPTSSATAMALDASGRIYVGLQRGGLFAWEGGRFERFGGTNSLAAQDFASSICMARDGTLWAGTLGGGLYGLRNSREVQFTTANGLADDTVLSVCVDKDGGLWASTRASTVHRITPSGTTRFDSSNGLPSAPVTVLIPAAAGGLWLGTEDGSVLRGEHDIFTGAQPAEKTRRRAVIALHEGSEERLWIGTAGGGLSCLYKGVMQNWTTANGLPHDFVAGVVEDAAKNLWLATGAGIYRIGHGSIVQSLANPSTPLACKLVSEAKTTSESTITVGGTRALLAAEGRMWFATSEGVLNIDIRQPEVESAPWPLLVESVTINGQASPSLLKGPLWADAKTNNSATIMPGDLRTLDIHFTALNFTAPEKIRFRCRLEGFESDWVDNGTFRFAHYSRLPYGNYRFHLSARTTDGDWQEAATPFAFIIPTPLYLQSWAIALYVIAAIALIAIIVRVVSHRRLRFALAQLEQQQSLERERMRIARDMHDEMGSKLTKISFLSEHARVEAPEGALSRKIESIAESSRELLKTMDEIVWVVNPRNDTLEHLAAYLTHYADEYFQNTSVECELRLPQATSHFPLSSETRHNLFLAFEETLNNVLKHSGATKVKVEMILSAPKFEIVVTDNGRGFQANGAQSTGNRGGRGGNGLKNMQQRLADIGGECLIHSQPEGGTTVTLRIHLNQHNGARKP